MTLTTWYRTQIHAKFGVSRRHYSTLRISNNVANAHDRDSTDSSGVGDTRGGHLYYVSGSEIYHVIAAQLNDEMDRRPRASHGIFVPSDYGTYPDAHSQSGIKLYMGTSLPEIESYDDFVPVLATGPSLTVRQSPSRRAEHPRYLHTTHGNLGLAYKLILGRLKDAHQNHSTISWYVNGYMHSDDPGVFPLGEAVLDGLQFGSKRNYGYGETRLKAAHGSPRRNGLPSTRSQRCVSHRVSDTVRLGQRVS